MYIQIKATLPNFIDLIFGKNNYTLNSTVRQKLSKEKERLLGPLWTYLGRFSFLER